MDSGVDESRIIVDAGVSGKDMERDGLKTLRLALHDGDTVYITKLDRLGRNTRDVLTVVQDWKERGIGVRFIEQGIETGGAMGKVMITMLSAFAEFERTMILERTQAGLDAAKQSGKVCHRKRSYSDKKALKASELRRKGLTFKEIASVLHSSTRTIQRMLQTAEEIEGKEQQ